MDELSTALRGIIRDEVARQLAELEQPAPDTPSALLGVEQAAIYLGLRTKTLYEWRRLRKGPPAHWVGRVVKYRRGDLDAWLSRPTTGGDLLTVAEAAEYAKRHPRTIADACRTGDLKGVQRTKGASWRVRREDIDTWLGIKPPVHRGPLRAL